MRLISLVSRLRTIPTKKLIIPIVIVLLATTIALLLLNGASTADAPARSVVSTILPTRGHILLMSSGSAIRSLSGGTRTPISADDTIRTLSDSEATIFWADGSYTRLGTGTTVHVRELKTDPANHISQVRFHLESGRTWSHIMSYLIGDSYFKESIKTENVVATVRGTVYDVDTTKGYIQAVDHEVTLTNTTTNRTTTVSAGNAIDYISFGEYMHSLIDAAWVAANTTADQAEISDRLNTLADSFTGGTSTGYLSSMQTLLYGPSTDDMVHRLGGAVAREDIPGVRNASSEIMTTLSGGKLSSEQIGHLHEQLLDLYSQVHGLVDGPMLTIKPILRDLIVRTAQQNTQQEEQSNFARYDLYDYYDAVRGGSTSATDLAGRVSDSLHSGIISTGALDTFRQGLSHDDLQKYTPSFDILGSTTSQIRDYFSHVDTSGVQDSVNKGINQIKQGTQGILDHIRGQ